MWIKCTSGAIINSDSVSEFGVLHTGTVHCKPVCAVMAYNVGDETISAYKDNHRFISNCLSYEDGAWLIKDLWEAIARGDKTYQAKHSHEIPKPD
jgi:hypothetical protein